MTETVLGVKGMSCSHCENRVNKAVLAVPGVVSCQADAQAGSIKFSHNGADLAAVKAAIEDAGYDVV